MKMKKLVGALALTAALAMGTAPAFATVGSDGAFAGGTGSTAVKATATGVNINATVPLTITCTMGVDKHSEIQFPSPEAYKITNNGTAPIKVTNVKATMVHDQFVFGTLKQVDGDWYTNGSDYITPSVNTILLKYADGTNLTYLTDTKEGKDAASADKGYCGTTAPGTWTEKVISANSSMGITLTGDVYMPSKITEGTIVGADLCTLTYTVADAS